MLHLVAEFFDRLLTWPTLPFTALLLLMTVYWLVVSLGFLAFDAIDLDFDFDADIDVDPGAHASLLDIGFLPLKWLNLGSVPLMIWGSVFTLTAWVIARWLNTGNAHEEFIFASDTQIILRDGLIAAIATKFLTNPMRGMFDFEEPNRLETLLGQTVRVTTSEVTEAFGEVEYITDGAPLRLNARCANGTLSKNEAGQITGYDPDTRVYFIEPVSGTPTTEMNDTDL